jgi:Acetoacetate decarboxylase (ADC)
MTQFIERVDDPEIPPPYTFPGVTIHSFELEADIECLKELCDTLLNIGSPAQRGFEYRPLLPYVALEVLIYPKMTSDTGRFANLGYVSQYEAYFRFPVVKFEAIGLLRVPTEVSNFFPYLFVDSSWSAFSGRNVIGFPKVIGTITQETDPNKPYSASVKVPVFPKPQTKQSVEEVISIQTGTVGSAGASAKKWPWAITSMKDLVGDAESLLVELEEMFDPDFFSTIQLKQIRDAEDPNTACFQGLIHSRFKVDHVSPPQLYDSASIDLHSFESLKMVSELGLSPSNPIKPVLAYHTTCNMTFGACGATKNLFINTTRQGSPAESGDLITEIIRLLTGAE